MDQKNMIESMLTARKKHRCFEQSIEQRSDTMTYRFYDGPPFGSGDPHYGHLLASTIKDTIPRFKTMCGYKVHRRRGRDCHGIPAENAVEKKYNIPSKKYIEEEFGIQNFVEACRSYILDVDANRKRFVEHLGRRVDMDNAYFTMDSDFMESVISIFGVMYDQNLIYKGFKVQGYSVKLGTALSHSEIAEGYQEKQDPAITIAFDYKGSSKNDYHRNEDGLIEVVAGVIKHNNKYLMIHHAKSDTRVFPGGKKEIGQNNEQALNKEIKEELGVSIRSMKALGSYKALSKGDIYLIHFFEIDIEGQPTIQEKDKAHDIAYVEIQPDDVNTLGFSLVINNTIIHDEQEIIMKFKDIYYLAINIFQHEGLESAPVSFLAWTTTPRTLTANTFLAVGADIIYAYLFHKKSKRYFIIAQECVTHLTKNKDEYIILFLCKGIHLLGMHYKPLFSYLTDDKTINTSYKSQIFCVIEGDFVSTESGTGIVHIAPAFGEDDFRISAQKLGYDNAQERLFMPIDNYGQFDHRVPDYQGTIVYEANKDIIQTLKHNNQVIKHETIMHSYPFCPRTDTPMIYRAIESRFVKENELKQKTVPSAEQINFCPESIKKRFIKGLESAPDRNISRNRYRGSPLPIRQSEKDENKRIVLSSREKIYQATLQGSKNLTKHIVMRHGHTNFNEKKWLDSRGESILTKLGQQQAHDAVSELQKCCGEQRPIIVVSPLRRTFDTIAPFIKTLYDEIRFSQIEAEYEHIINIFQTLYDEQRLIHYLNDETTQKLFLLGEEVYCDIRLTDIIGPEYQGKVFDCSQIQRSEEPISASGENIFQTEKRIHSYIQNISDLFATRTIISVSHGDPIVLFKKYFKKFDFIKRKSFFYPKNASIVTLYYDNTRKAELDLHKPYIDTYRTVIDGEVYKRIPDVLDCWFESGAMPYGQESILFDQGKPNKNTQEFYPAEFIAEGLDQTRGRFRTLHILGNALMNKSAFNNVIVNGLVMAEDGRKMSKRLKNYPDPKVLFEKRGADAFRLYMLNSPIVKAEPLKFSEKNLEQTFKDTILPLENCVHFLQTYAHADQFTKNTTRIFFMRHGQAEGKGFNAQLTEDGIVSLKTNNKREEIIRTQADVIIYSPALRASATASIVREIFLENSIKNPDFIEEPLLRESSNVDLQIRYDHLTSTYKNKTILIIAHEKQWSQLRSHLYQRKVSLETGGIIQLPLKPITNDLDRWILGQFHHAGQKIYTHLTHYELDVATKTLINFLEDLTNRYIRRSRRRFWSHGMSADKLSAYETLYTVIEGYLHCLAPFAPFISDHLYQKIRGLQAHTDNEFSSIHLRFFPLFHHAYYDQQLHHDIEKVQKIIKLGNYIRAKHQQKIKQPLRKINIQIN